MQHLVIGPGRVGLSMAGYARHHGCAVEIVGREDLADGADRVRRLAGRADVVAIATPDDAIPGVIAALEGACGGKTVHFSGARTFAGAWSLHPLYSFPTAPLRPEVLADVPFAVEPGSPLPGEVFPGAVNPAFEVGAGDRALYHAIAVLAANFAAHIWNESAGVFADRFPDAPPDALALLLESCVDRFRETPTASMTGPAARRDANTVAANLAALEASPRLSGLYRGFLASAWPGYTVKVD